MVEPSEIPGLNTIRLLMLISLAVVAVLSSYVENHTPRPSRQATSHQQ